MIFNHAEMRMAKTRAVNRALRKANGIALCTLQDLPPRPLPPEQIPCCATSFSTDRRFAKEFCVRPAPTRHAAGNWSALLRAWTEKSYRKFNFAMYYISIGEE